MRHLFALLVVTAVVGCGSFRYEWATEPAPGSVEPLPEEAPVTLWLPAPPHHAYNLVCAADNPMIGTGPPAAIPLAEASIVFSGSANVRWSRVFREGREAARRFGGDHIVFERRTVAEPTRIERLIGAWRIRVLRSLP